MCQNPVWRLPSGSRCFCCTHRTPVRSILPYWSTATAVCIRICFTRNMPCSEEVEGDLKCKDASHRHTNVHKDGLPARLPQRRRTRPQNEDEKQWQRGDDARMDLGPDIGALDQLILPFLCHAHQAPQEGLCHGVRVHDRSVPVQHPLQLVRHLRMNYLEQQHTLQPGYILVDPLAPF